MMMRCRSVGRQLTFFCRMDLACLMVICVSFGSFMISSSCLNTRANQHTSPMVANGSTVMAAILTPSHSPLAQFIVEIINHTKISK